MLEQTARLRDRKARRVARQNRVGSRDPLESLEQSLFGRQVFGNRFRHELCGGNSLCFGAGGEKAGEYPLDVVRFHHTGGVESRQVFTDTLDQ